MSKKVKNVLVIGGSGYLGNEVVNRLLETKDYQVFSYSNHENEKCASVIGNILDCEKLNLLYKNNNIDVTIILCGLKSIQDSSKNLIRYSNNDIVGLINILNSCASNGCKKVIFFSSSSIYSSGWNLNESATKEIKCFYSFIKDTSEKLLQWYKLAYGIDYVILRCFNVSGCSKYTKQSKDIIYLALKNKSLNIFGNNFQTYDGTLIRDYIHVSDVAKATIKSIEFKGSATINIGTNQGYSVLDIIKLIEKRTTKKIPVNWNGRREFDQDILVADISKAKKLLNWEPQCDINQIIESTIENC